MKKIYLLFLLMSLPLVASADAVEINGIYYNLNQSSVANTAEVTRIPSNKYTHYSGSKVIPTTVTYNKVVYSVTSIGDRAFEDCSSLTSVVIPNSVTSIGEYAFNNCDELTSVIIPNSVTSIGTCAFLSCGGLISVTIGNGVTSIGSDAFAVCGNLSYLTIGNSVTSIGDEAFSDCSSLTSLTIPNSVTSIGADAFAYCKGLISMTIPNSVTNIGDGIFDHCSGLTSVVIGKGVTSIAGSAFSGCNSLTSVIIPNSVRSIGEEAFEDCSSLTSLTIPNSVTSIGSFAFYKCNGLTSVHITDLEAWCKISFDNTNESTNPLYYAHHLFLNDTEIKDLVIPNSVPSIGDNAFAGCEGLTSVTIPNSVRSIGTKAFTGCSGLSALTIGNGLTSIGDKAFRYCSALNDVWCFAENVPETHTNTFSDTNIRSASLHVPVGSVEAYKAADPWSGFNEKVAITAKVKLTKTKATLEKTKTLTLKATVTPSTLLDKSVTWKSSNTSVATVTSSGKVKGIKAGTATITCTSKVSGEKATCKVTVGYVKLDQTEAVVKKGKTITLTPTVYPSSLTDKSVTWESSDTKIATVTAEGTVKGIKYGSATITCTSVVTGLRTTCIVWVGNVVLSETKLAVQKGKTVTLKATVYPSILEDKSVTWESSDTKIATVTSAGKVKGVKAGTATITCTSVKTGISSTCKVTVTIGAVTLDKSEAYVQKGKTMTLTATVTPSTLEDKSVTWESSDTKIATVTSDGKVKGIKYGTATITCTSNATGMIAKCQVTVGKVVISMSEVTLKRSRSMTLEAIVYPTSLADKSVTWESSDTQIATVTNDGRVKGIKAGTATITCTSVATGLKGTCTVTVLSTSETRSTDGDDDGTIGNEMMEDRSAVAGPYDVYDLSGHKVRHQVTSLEGLPNGIYIVNGKKVLKK